MVRVSAGSLIAECQGELMAQALVLLGKLPVALVGDLQSLSQRVVGGPLPTGDGRTVRGVGRLLSAERLDLASQVRLRIEPGPGDFRAAGDGLKGDRGGFGLEFPQRLDRLGTGELVAALCGQGQVVGRVSRHGRGRTGLGRRMLAVRSNERAAAAAGVNVRAVKIAAFAISSFIASAAGTLYGYNFGSVSAVRFTALAALGLIGFAYIGGITMVSGAVIAGLLSTEALIPHALDKWFGIKGTWALLFGGSSLIVTLIANPDGIAGANHRRKKAKRAARAAKAAPALAVDATPDTAGAETAPTPEEVAR
jgi:hypothetical protein